MITVTIQADTPVQYRRELQALIEGLGGSGSVTLSVDGTKLAETSKPVKDETAEAEAKAAADAKKAAAKKAAAKAAKEAAEAAAKAAAAAEAAEDDDDADLEVDMSADDESVKKWTKEDVETKLKELARGGFNDEVKAIISGAGAARLSVIDPSKYGQVMEQASALDADE